MGWWWGGADEQRQDPRHVGVGGLDGAVRRSQITFVLQFLFNLDLDQPAVAGLNQPSGPAHPKWMAEPRSAWGGGGGRPRRGPKGAQAQRKPPNPWPGPGVGGPSNIFKDRQEFVSVAKIQNKMNKMNK